MCNISSATSMYEEDDFPRRPFPWRGLTVFLLLLAAVVYAALVFPSCLRQARAEHQEIYLALAGVVAESLELQWDERTLAFPDLLTGETVKLFEIDDALAYVRVRDHDHALIVEVTRTAPDRARLSVTPELPDLGANAEIKTLAKRLTDLNWQAPIGGMQLLILAQADLTGVLGEAANGDAPDEFARSSLYSQQDLALTLAETAAESVPLLDGAVACMRNVLDALSRGDADALHEAYRASVDAQSALAYALEAHRSLVGERFPLPAALAAFAPPPSWVERLGGPAAGRRVLVPLFASQAESKLARHLGWCEAAFYEYPAAPLSALALPALPALAALLVAGLLLVAQRRRTCRAVAAAEHLC